MKTIKRDIVVAVILSSDDHMLLGKMRQGGVYPDCWHNPGGGVDTGETFNQALRREIIEETNLDIDAFNPEIKLIDDTATGQAEKTDRGTGEPFIADMRFYTYLISISLPASQIHTQPTDDLTELSWFPRSELSSVKLTPPAVDLFTKLGWI